MHKFKLKGCKSAVALALSAVLVAGMIPVNFALAANDKTTNKNANEVVADMTVGFNIGNTLDAFGEAKNFPLKNSNETGWGNPEISEELVQAIGAAGFNTVRIPVSWGQYTVGDNYEIPSFIMNRVKEVVDYCIDNDMYVILNTHHDINDNFEFYYPTSEKKDKSEKYLSSVWTQIAKEFKDYDSHLVFETMNEPRMVGHQAEWWFYRQAPTADVIDAIECINDFNQVSLDAIRKTGGNNATRCVMVPGYDASIDGAMVDQFKLPKDTAKDRLIVSVHAYTPYSFALDGYGTDKFTNGADIDALFNDLESKYLSKGTPVVIGEMGASNKNNLSERIKWADYYFGAAAEYDNLAMAIWDNNVYKNPDAPGECHGYINRITCKWREPEFIETVMKYVDGTPAKSFGSTGNSGTTKPTVESGRAGEIVKDMTVGWNIGNSLEAVAENTKFPVTISQETAGGNLAITKEMIDEVAKAGFNTIRIPVSWGQYTTGTDYKIPSWLMNRVKEIADYAIADGMYVIIDSHRDICDVCQFYYPDDAHREESIKYLSSIWSQIAKAFKNYDDKVLFETMNEPRLVGESEEWWFPRANPGAKVEESVACINDYNQACLDAIRSVGGKNADRCVIVCGYDSSIDGVMVNGFELPKDTVKNRIIVAVHAYTPYYFALEPYSNVVEKFEDSDINQLDTLFYDLKKKFVNKGTPVIITETGCLKRSNNQPERIKWVNYYWGAAKEIADLAVCLNDNNVFETWGTGLGLLNRKTLKWDDPEFIESIMKYVDGTPAKVGGVVVKPSTEAPTEMPTEAPTKAPSTEAPTKVPSTEAPTEMPTEAPTKVPSTEAPTKVPSTEAPTKAPSTDAPSTNGLKLEVTLNDWGSGFQYMINVKNEGPKVDTWTVKVKKSDIKIESYWCVNIKEEGDYYVITPYFWNAVLDKGQLVSFGVQGTKRSSNVNFTVK